ncbi:hypothetical protein HPB50_023050 [Hyalomma asiaticum]|uniref:Uncharacterized protein n=1 Tax=Hyalomma asiaticum TaxID=266040 RepID=A0ACB7TRU9_HYAAI|nr:hypothetical protein HPB50_023050 [Hyalomma asiaticum]
MSSGSCFSRTLQPPTSQASRRDHRQRSLAFILAILARGTQRRAAAAAAKGGSRAEFIADTLNNSHAQRHVPHTHGALPGRTKQAKSRAEVFFSPPSNGVGTHLRGRLMAGGAPYVRADASNRRHNVRVRLPRPAPCEATTRQQKLETKERYWTSDDLCRAASCVTWHMTFDLLERSAAVALDGQ